MSTLVAPSHGRRRGGCRPLSPVALKELMKSRNNKGPRNEPWGAPDFTSDGSEDAPSTTFDYAMIIWNPHTVKYIESIEGVQRRATKVIPEIKKLSYPERLKYLRLPTMAYRRARGDMIEVYKIIKEIYDSKTTCNILKYRDKIHH